MPIRKEIVANVDISAQESRRLGSQEFDSRNSILITTAETRRRALRQEDSPLWMIASNLASLGKTKRRIDEWKKENHRTTWQEVSVLKRSLVPKNRVA